MVDPIRAAAERLLKYLEANRGHDGIFPLPESQEEFNLRAALAAELPAPGPTTDDIWELCEDHEFHIGDGFDDEASAEIMLRIIRVALTRWGRPAPAPTPAAEEEGEREELAQWLEFEADNAQELGCATVYDHDRLRWAAGYLRQPAPAPVPVPVAERPWERPGWCDAEGRCWWFAPPEAIAGGFRSAGWGLYAGPPADEDTHCLPHWALPLPQPTQGGEVQ